MQKSLRHFAVMMLGAGVVAIPAHATIVFDNHPTVLPDNIASLGYQATQTAEFGDLIQLDGTARSLTSVTLTMSDWAKASDYGSADPTWTQPLTLTLYSIDNSGAIPLPGPVIATVADVFAIPWRPEDNPTAAPAVAGSAATKPAIAA